MLSIQTSIWFQNLSRYWHPHQRNGNIFTNASVIESDYQLSKRGAHLIFQELFWPCQLRNYSRKIPNYESSHKCTHPSSSCVTTGYFQLHIILLSHQERRRITCPDGSALDGTVMLQRGQQYRNRKQKTPGWAEQGTDDMAAYGMAGDYSKWIWSCLSCWPVIQITISLRHRIIEWLVLDRYLDWFSPTHCSQQG